MLDRASPEMTGPYATIEDQTLRREWERFRQRIKIHIDDTVISARERYAIQHAHRPAAPTVERA